MNALLGMTRNQERTNQFADLLELSPEFVRSYLEANDLVAQAEASSDYPSFLGGLSPLMQMYAGFALSTSQRGREIFNLLSTQLGRAPTGSYLDIGCGYGGFVRVFASNGLRSTGVEIVPHLAEYSRKNCSGFANATIIEGSFLNADEASLGQFDCITCNDVIEHIEDPPQTIAKISRMLKPDGILMMEIPNRTCLHWLPSDGHFQLFGISGLPRDTAGRYFHETTGQDYFGSMGEFYDYQVYLDLLSQNGLNATILETHLVAPFEELPAHAARALGSLDAFNKGAASQLHPITRRSVQTHVAGIVAAAIRDYAEACRTGVYRATQRRYMHSFWTLIARRNDA